MTNADNSMLLEDASTKYISCQRNEGEIIQLYDESSYAYRLHEDDTVRLAYLETALSKNRSRMTTINIRLDKREVEIRYE
jgi:hypothetical protein